MSNMLALLWKNTQEILSYFLFLSPPNPTCVHPSLHPSLLYANNKIHLPVSPDETRGDASTQHAPLRGRSRLPQHLSVRRRFSNYNSHTITHTSQYIQMHTHPHTAHSHTVHAHRHAQQLPWRALNGFPVAFQCILPIQAPGRRVWQLASGYTLCTAKPPHNNNVIILPLIITIITATYKCAIIYNHTVRLWVFRVNILKYTINYWNRKMFHLLARRIFYFIYLLLMEAQSNISNKNVQICLHVQVKEHSYII